MTDHTLIRTSAMTALPELIRELGQDPEPLLQQFNISEAAIANPKQMMPYVRSIQLLERAAELCECADFGLRMSQKQSLSVLGPIAIIAQNSSTVFDALQRIGRYIGYHSPGLWVEVDHPETTDSPRLCCDSMVAAGTPKTQKIELSIGFAMKVLSVLHGATFRPRKVLFRHAPVSAPACYRNHFGCPVLFEQTHNALLLQPDDLTRVIDHNDPGMRRTMEEFVEHSMSASTQCLSDQVRHLIIRLLPLERRCTLDIIASHLAMSRRSLQRALKDEGAVFEELVEQIRKELARDYLAQAHMSMAQIAGLLGYNGQSSFNRACQRWFQASPSRVREQVA